MNFSRGTYWRVTLRDSLEGSLEIFNVTFGRDQDGELSCWPNLFPLMQIFWVQTKPGWIHFTALMYVSTRAVCDALSVYYINSRRLESSELALSEMEFNILTTGSSSKIWYYSAPQMRVPLNVAYMSFPTVLATYSPGSNVGSLHWIWRTDTRQWRMEHEDSACISSGTCVSLLLAFWLIFPWGLGMKVHLSLKACSWAGRFNWRESCCNWLSWTSSLLDLVEDDLRMKLKKIKFKMWKVRELA